jgi:hypothetical protein
MITGLPSPSRRFFSPGYPSSIVSIGLRICPSARPIWSQGRLVRTQEDTRSSAVVWTVSLVRSLSSLDCCCPRAVSLASGTVTCQHHSCRALSAWSTMRRGQRRTGPVAAYIVLRLGVPGEMNAFGCGFDRGHVGREEFAIRCLSIYVV